jgi:hypothetical protein
LQSIETPVTTKKGKISPSWITGAVFLCFWLILLFISMNWQYKRGMRIAGYTKELATILFFIILITSPRRLKLPLYFKILFIFTVFSGCIWGLHDTFYWDGIQTCGRSILFINGEFDNLPRFSLNYAILGLIFKYIGNYNWTGHLYIMIWGGLLLLMLSKNIRIKKSRYFVVLMALSAPHIFVLSKWLYMDIPLAAGIFISVLAMDQAIKKPSFFRYLTAIVLLIISVLLKEIGVIAVIPFLFLPFIVPKEKRFRSIFFSLAVLGIVFGLFMIQWNIYKSHNKIDSSHVQWLLFNKNVTPDMWLTVKWFFEAITEHLGKLLWWGFLGFAVLGTIKVHKKWGYYFVAAILICQIFSIIAARSFNLSSMWHPRPLNEPDGKLTSNLMMLFAAFILSAGLITKNIRFHKLKRIEWFSWIMIISVILIFSATGKYYLRKNGKLALDIDWRYLTPAIPFSILLAGKNIHRIFSRCNPFWLRIIGFAAFTITLHCTMLRSVDLAVYFGEKARLNGEFYEAAKKRPERLIFTHWPFFMDSKKVYDYGNIQWKSDAFTLESLTLLQHYNKNPQNRPRQKILALQTKGIMRSVKIWKNYDHIILEKNLKIYYLRPFDHHLHNKRIAHNYLILQNWDKENKK